MSQFAQPALQGGARQAPYAALPVWQTLLAGVAAPVVVWTLLHPVLGVRLVADTGNGAHPVGIAAVVVTALVVSLGALGTARLARRAGRPRRAFLLVALGVLLVSLLGPLTGSVSAVGALGLVLLHLSVAGAVVPLVARRLPARRLA